MLAVKKKKFDNVLEGGFVEDLFFAKSNWMLKVREIAVPVILWGGFFYSQLSIINSYSPKAFIPFMYHWSNEEGHDFTNYVSLALTVGFAVVMAFSIFLLLRNNHNEKVYFERHKLYDEAKVKQREEALDSFYEARFGDRESRESIRFYSVKAEQNFQNGEVEGLFKEKGLEIK
ncbi:hypothetical protein [Lactococcus termiticola]|uniref:Uncharacterized protein n=1 Tax=Lactococcus termiticola TaxID=2169526 RepID=A0A2R5HGP0_9LACT|nr:hypothetical protein [Lactococcus termiticola]GBG97184.1 hypothetical protein NtB2_01322 [Lactococcus termiticola]